MSEEKKERWLSYLATTTVVLAVLATLSTFFGQKNSTKSVISEIKASNQWGYYQAKKIRSYLFEVQKDNLEEDLKVKGQGLSTDAKQSLERRVNSLGTKISKWEQEMTTISEAAKGFEQARDEALNHGKNFGLAVVFLQMAILLSSIAALMKMKPVWICGLFIGVIGVFFFVNGFALLA